MSKDKIETDVQGHANDGWFYAVDIVSGGTVRLGDHDNLQAVWARIREAQEKNEDVFFSGARTSTQDTSGKVTIGPKDGVGILGAKSIVMLRNYGDSALGVSPIEVRLNQLAETIARHDETVAAVVNQINEVTEDLNDLVGELEEKKVIEVQADDVPDGTPAPLTVSSGADEE